MIFYGFLTNPGVLSQLPSSFSPPPSGHLSDLVFGFSQAGQPTPHLCTLPRNKGFIAGLIERNQWLINITQYHCHSWDHPLWIRMSPFFVPPFDVPNQKTPTSKRYPAKTNAQRGDITCDRRLMMEQNHPHESKRIDIQNLELLNRNIFSQMLGFIMVIYPGRIFKNINKQNKSKKRCFWLDI